MYDDVVLTLPLCSPHYWLKNVGRNGSKIALRHNFYVAFRTFVGI